MELSNKSLAFLLVVAVVVSLFGTMTSLHKLGRVSITDVTGRATNSDQGTANLTITTDIQINFDVDNVNFGSGTVDPGAGNTCDLDTNSTSNQTGFCNGFITTASPFLINNTGNADAALLLRSSYDAANFTGGTGARLQWWMDDEPGAQIASCNAGTIEADWTNVSTTNTNVCPSNGFQYEYDRDTAYLHMRVVIPQDATQVGTQRIATITATLDDQK